MLSHLTGWHLVILLVILLLLVGSTQLPRLARSIGQSMRIVRTDVAGLSEPQGPPDEGNATQN
jgi:sec-independent protein translocase protein TatA